MMQLMAVKGYLIADKSHPLTAVMRGFAVVFDSFAAASVLLTERYILFVSQYIFA